MFEIAQYTPQTLTEREFAAAALAEDFKKYISGQVSETTADSYFVCIRNFLSWTRENGIRQPNRDDIIRYKEFLASEHESPRRGMIRFSATTQARYLRAVKSFFRWADSRGFYPYPCDDIAGAKVKANVLRRDAFSDDEMNGIITSFEPDTELNARDLAMIQLAAGCGLRVIELQRMDCGDLEITDGQAWIRIQGKGHTEKDFQKKVEKRVYDAVMTYLSFRKNKAANAPLFTACGRRSTGKRLTEPAISAILKKRIVSAGIDSPRKTAHSFRHYFVTADLETNGGNIQEACDDVGHSSVAVTQHYAHNVNRKNSTAAERVAGKMFKDEKTGAGTKTAAAQFFGTLTLEEQAYYMTLIKQQQQFARKTNAV